MKTIIVAVQEAVVLIQGKVETGQETVINADVTVRHQIMMMITCLLFQADVEMVKIQSC